MELIDTYKNDISLLIKKCPYKLRHIDENIYRIEFDSAKNIYFYIQSKNKFLDLNIIYFINDKNETEKYELSKKIFSNDLCQVWELKNHSNKVIKIKTLKREFNFDEIDFLLRLTKNGVHTTINNIENIYGKLIILESNEKNNWHILYEYSYIIMNKFISIDDIDFDFDFNFNYKKLIVDCVQTLKQIHQMSLSHNDIKLNNIMYDDIHDKYVIIDYDRMFKPNRIIVSWKYDEKLITYLLRLGYDLNDYMHSYPNDLMALFYTVCELIVSFDYIPEWIKKNRNIIVDDKEFYEQLVIERNKIRDQITDQLMWKFYKIVLRYRYSYSLTFNYIEHYYDEIINLFYINKTESND